MKFPLCCALVLENPRCLACFSPEIQDSRALTVIRGRAVAQIDDVNERWDLPELLPLQLSDDTGLGGVVAAGRLPPYLIVVPPRILNACMWSTRAGNCFTVSAGDRNTAPGIPVTLGFT